MTSVWRHFFEIGAKSSEKGAKSAEVEPNREMREKGGKDEQKMDDPCIGIADKYGAWHSHPSFDAFTLGAGYDDRGIPVWGLGGKRKMSWKK